MKSTVLIIGQNVERQVINLDEQDVLFDEQQRAWLDIKFDNRFLRAEAFERQFSQLYPLKQAFKNLNFEVIKTNYDEYLAQRVVLRAGEAYKIIRTGQFDDQLWQTPEYTPRALVLLDSVNFSEAILREVADYLEQFPKIQLVLEYRFAYTTSEAGRRLLRRANLVWLDMVSHQVAEQATLIDSFDYQEQLLLVNHPTGLSLSDKQRTYKITNADYLSLKPLEWLAVTVKTLDYQFDIEDRLNLIAQIGKILVRSNKTLTEIDAKQALVQNPAIELIRGQPNLAKRTAKRIEALMDRRTINLDLTHETNANLMTLLEVRDLPRRATALLMSEADFKKLFQKKLPLINQLAETILLGLEYQPQLRAVDDFKQETIAQMTSEIEAKLNEADFYKIKIAKLTLPLTLGQNLPTQRAILGNVQQAAVFAKSVLSRHLIAWLELALTAKISLDWRPSAVATELKRLVRSLVIQLKTEKLNLEQVVICLNLPTKQGASLSEAHLAEILYYLKQQLANENWTLNLVIKASGTYWSLAENQYFPVVCQPENYAAIFKPDQTKIQQKIRFSQFLCQ